jgi:hypothetical protein
MTPEVDAELEPDDVFLARLAAMRAKRKAAKEAAAEAAKPKLVAAVSPEIAEAIKTNPSSLRLSVNRADDIPVVDRPRRTELLEVLEVDAEGRSSRVARFECATGARSVLDYAGGYRQPAGATHVYDPYSALKGSEND